MKWISCSVKACLTSGRVMIKDNKVIVVDYKFGERQDKRHPNQVRNYLQLIRKMGFERVMDTFGT